MEDKGTSANHVSVNELLDHYLTVRNSSSSLCAAARALVARARELVEEVHRREGASVRSGQAARRCPLGPKAMSATTPEVKKVNALAVPAVRGDRQQTSFGAEVVTRAVSSPASSVRRAPTSC